MLVPGPKLGRGVGYASLVNAYRHENPHGASGFRDGGWTGRQRKGKR